jgi:[protein-PII] uridylyltransferase
MHECGVLDEYIPEFGKLDCLVQHEFYHRYTTDEHTLVAIEKLDEVLRSTTDPYARYSRIFQKIERPHLLYLAILLHDTGKAVRVRHHSDASAECARRVSRRLGLDSESSRILLFLVDHHTTMSNLAQRRDIEDPATIEDLRSLTQTQERLDMLHLLTFVDGLAVGSNVWNEWRQSLLWQLHEYTSRAINSSGVEKVDIQVVREGLKNSVLPKLPSHILEDEIESHFSCMPERYWRRIDQESLVLHFETLHSFFEKLLETELIGTSPVVTWRHFPDRGYSEATVCSWDRHGLFSKIAGSFTAARINILSADIYTRTDDLVLDIFHVCDLEHRSISSQSQMEKMEKILANSLTETEEVPFTQLIQSEYESMRHIPYQQEETFPTYVTFNNEDSTDYTILEIQTPDRLGLLYQVLRVLSDCGLDISLARINTEKGAAMDAFYLTDVEGKKILDSNYLQSVQKQLVDTINKLNQPYRLASV